MALEIELLLFTTECHYAARTLNAGVQGIVVDWERHGKDSRQLGFDTEINMDTPDDLRRLATLHRGALVCRINPWHEGTTVEVDLAVASGATEILLPMVNTPEEVERFLYSLRGRAKAGILVETDAACGCSHELAEFQLHRVYVGLNDLAISRKSRNIFFPFLDGTVEYLRECFRRCSFGVAGATVVDGGSPLPCNLLLAEMARLDVDFTFLRRSFNRDIRSRVIEHEVPLIKETWRQLRSRSVREIELDHRRAVRVIEELGR